MGLLLRQRVRPLMALAGALAFGASQGFVRMASVAWSEAPYAAIALGTLVVLSRRPIKPVYRPHVRPGLSPSFTCSSASLNVISFGICMPNR